ncbi:hypothetical protein MES5069_650003 [Mesorhizobium escarrei]|uniref:Lytic murein transglycosylase n=1 Tax=Mesorhizobium escarrei TaxID=666018 RepID=A0ABN8KEI8_9HYPH|nr:hypothetical protein MES5069_650003 [Mesorhizobium escarrei]
MPKGAAGFFEWTCSLWLITTAPAPLEPLTPQQPAGDLSALTTFVVPKLPTADTAG